MRPLVPSLAVVLLLVGCATAPAPPATPVAERGQVLATLQDEVAEVARLQTDADTAVNDVLDGVRRVEQAVGGLSDPTSVETTLDGYPEVHEVVAATRAEGLRDGYLQVAAAVDEARGALAAARQELDGTPWEVAYLDAQDEVLVRVRAYAESADRLAQLLERHWPTYVEVDEVVAEAARRRDDLGDPAAARGAMATALDPLLEDLVVAQAQIAEYAQERAASGRAVNDATAELRSVHERRSGAPGE